MHDDCPNPEIILHKNKIGCVIQCAHCSDLLVKVENILYSCNIKSYNSLCNIINYVESNLEDHIVEIMKEKYVLICTPNDNINLNFSIDDFELLVELFEQSKHMLEVNELLS